MLSDHISNDIPLPMKILNMVIPIMCTSIFVHCKPLCAHLYLFTVNLFGPGRVAQSVTCLATDACLTADPGVASSIPVRSHTFVEIDHE